MCDVLNSTVLGGLQFLYAASTVYSGDLCVNTLIYINIVTVTSDK